MAQEGVTRELLDSRQTAHKLGISRATLYRRHNGGHVPKPMRLGGCVRWRRSELEAWIAAGMPPRLKWEQMRRNSGDK
jgi:predicted DNA-binding transcriptional regulator AlpA